MNGKSCTTCGNPIPAARLAAQPNAKQCVPCLSASGDVPRIRRYDERNCESTHETYFTHNPQFDSQLQRLNVTVPSNSAFFVAMGDDSKMARARNSIGSAGTIAEEIKTAKEEEKRYGRFECRV